MCGILKNVMKSKHQALDNTAAQGDTPLNLDILSHLTNGALTIFGVVFIVICVIFFDISIYTAIKDHRIKKREILRNESECLLKSRLVWRWTRL